MRRDGPSLSVNTHLSLMDYSKQDRTGPDRTVPLSGNKADTEITLSLVVCGLLAQIPLPVLYCLPNSICWTVTIPLFFHLFCLFLLGKNSTEEEAVMRRDLI